MFYPNAQVGALYSLSFGMILTSLMVICFDGYMTRRPIFVVATAVLHLGAACLVRRRAVCCGLAGRL
jgi:hypothetical protein